jgi:hypothetical protein
LSFYPNIIFFFLSVLSKGQNSVLYLNIFPPNFSRAMEVFCFLIGFA